MGVGVLVFDGVYERVHVLGIIDHGRARQKELVSGEGIVRVSATARDPHTPAHDRVRPRLNFLGLLTIASRRPQDGYGPLRTNSRVFPQ